MNRSLAAWFCSTPSANWPRCIRWQPSPLSAAAWCRMAATISSSRRSTELQLLCGPHTENFRDIIGIFERAGAVRRISPGGFAGELLRLLDDAGARQELGRRAAEVVPPAARRDERTIAALELLYWGPTGRRARDRAQRSGNHTMSAPFAALRRGGGRAQRSLQARRVALPPPGAAGNQRRQLVRWRIRERRRSCCCWARC